MVFIPRVIYAAERGLSLRYSNTPYSHILAIQRATSICFVIRFTSVCSSTSFLQIAHAACRAPHAPEFLDLSRCVSCARGIRSEKSAAPDDAGRNPLVPLQKRRARRARSSRKRARGHTKTGACTPLLAGGRIRPPSYLHHHLSALLSATSPPIESNGAWRHTAPISLTPSRQRPTANGVLLQRCHKSWRESEHAISTRLFGCFYAIRVGVVTRSCR